MAQAVLAAHRRVVRERREFTLVVGEPATSSGCIELADEVATEPDDLVWRVADHLGDAAIDEDMAAITQIAHVDDARDDFEHMRNELSFVEQCRRRVFLFSDVHVDARHAHGAPVGRVRDAADRQQPHRAAFGMTDAEFGAEFGKVAAERFPHPPIHALDIRRVDMACRFFER